LQLVWPGHRHIEGEIPQVRGHMLGGDAQHIPHRASAFRIRSAEDRDCVSTKSIRSELEALQDWLSQVVSWLGVSLVGDRLRQPPVLVFQLLDG
jgi:hypothetical protein